MPRSETKLTCEEMEHPGDRGPGARTPEDWARLLSPQTEETRLAPTGRAQMPRQASRRWNRAAGLELEGLGSGDEPMEPQRASRAVGAISTKIRGSRGCLSSLIMEPHSHGGLAGKNVTKTQSTGFLIRASAQLPPSQTLDPNEAMTSLLTSSYNCSPDSYKDLVNSPSSRKKCREEDRHQQGRAESTC